MKISVQNVTVYPTTINLAIYHQSMVNQSITTVKVVNKKWYVLVKMMYNF